MTRKYFVIIIFILLDYLAVVAAEQGAVCVRNFFWEHSSILHISWLNYWIIFPILYLFFIHLNQLYSRYMPFYREVEQLFKSCCYATVSVIFVLYVVRLVAHTSRVFVGLFGIFTFIFIAFLRYLVKNFLCSKKLLQIPVLIIGAGKTAELLAKAITQDAGMGYKIIGLLEDNKVYKGILSKFPVLGNFSEAEKIIKKLGVRHVFIAAPGLEEHKLGMLIYRIQPLVENIGVIPNLVNVPTGGVEIETLFNEKILILRMKNNLAREWNRTIKIIFDYVLTILGTLVILPILIFIALWIYIDSPGAVVFKHIRIGKNGKSFPCYKFRTMCIDADKRLA